MMLDVLIPVLSMTGLGLLFAAILALANAKFTVEKDPRVDEINEVLPGVNCGACGYAGCTAFAEAVAKGEAPVNGCPVGRQEVADKIAAIMGTAADGAERQVAALICGGGNSKAKTKMEYHGIDDCIAANLVEGGDKACPHGCLGLATCVGVCPFDAITMSADGLPIVDKELCTGCEKCVIACPKDVLKMLPVSSEVLVACNSPAKGGQVMKVCKVGCIGCRKCVKICPVDAFTMEGALAVIDPEKCTNCGACIEVCPTNAIVRV